MTSTTARLVLLGAIAAIAQSLLLREAMTTLAGSEIAWGAVLSLWLLAAGIGARIGSAVSRLLPPPLGLSLVSLSATTGVFLLRATPTLTSMDTGETGLFGPVAIIWLSAIVPPAVAVGFSFARLAADTENASVAYGFESLGVVIGGLLFTFVLAPAGTAVVAGSLIGLGVGAFCSRRWAAAFAVAAGLTAGFVLSPWLARASWELGQRQGELAVAIESRHQRIELSRGESASVYIDGRLAGTLPPDPYLIGPRSEALLLLHPEPRRIAVIGGLANGIVSNFLVDPVEHLVVIEEDSRLVRLLRSNQALGLSRVLTDPGTLILNRSPHRSFEDLEHFDLVLLLDGLPSTIRSNRTRTRDFFKRCRQSLTANGILVVTVPGTGGSYSGGAEGSLLKIISGTLATAFPAVTALAMNPPVLVASVDDSSAHLTLPVLHDRWISRDQPGNAQLGILLPTIVDSQKTASLKSLISDPGARVNTAAHPTAVLPAAALTEGRGAHWLVHSVSGLAKAPTRVAGYVLAAVTLLVIIEGFVKRKRRTSPAVVTGFASLSWWLLLLTAWQGRFGTVYSEVGLLMALFMAGTAGGAMVVRRIKNPRRLLFGLFSTATAFSFVLALSPPANSAPTLLVCAGGLTGALFPGLAAIAGGRRRAVGIALAFSGDEIGAALAAGIVGVVALPWLGSTWVAIATATLCAAVIPGLLWEDYRSETTSRNPG